MRPRKNKSHLIFNEDGDKIETLHLDLN